MSALDEYLGQWSGSDSPKPDQNKSWWDTLKENAGDALGQIPKAAQGTFDLVAHDLPETAKNLADLPGTAIASGLEGLGVSDDTAKTIGGYTGMALDPLTIGQTAVAAGTGQAHPEQAGINTELLHPSTDDNRARFLSQFPAVAKLEQGFEDTGQRVFQEATGGVLSPYGLAHRAIAAATGGEQPTDPYVEAYQQGHLASVAIPDVANLALAADLAGGALTEGAQTARLGANAAAGNDAALDAIASAGPSTQTLAPRLAGQADRLESLARASEQGATLANKVAGAPLNLATAPVRVPLRWAETAARDNPAMAGVNEFVPPRELGPLSQTIDQTGLAQRAGQTLVPLGQLALDQKIKYASRGQASALPGGELALAARENNPAVLRGMDPTEGAAALAIGSGALTPEVSNLAQARIENRPLFGFPQESLPPGVTPEMQAIAQEHYAGTNPDLSQRLGEGIESWRGPEKAHAAARQEGMGEQGMAPTEGPRLAQFRASRAEEQGAAPMETAIDRAIKTGERLTPEQARQVRTGDATAIEDVKNQLRDNPDFAPPAYRPIVKMRQDMVTGARNEAAQLRTAGDHAGAQQLEDAADQVATTLRDITAQGQVPEALNVHYGTGMPGFAQTGSSPLTSKVGSQKERTGTAVNYNPEYQWTRWVEDMGKRFTNATAQDLAHTTGVRASSLAETPAEALALAREQRMVPFDPENLGRALTDKSVTPDTLFIPKPVMEGLNDLQRHQFSSQRLELAAQASDKFTRGWKQFVLPLSPKWLTGNLFGNSLEVGMVPGGFRALPEAVRMMKNPDLVTEAVRNQGATQQIAEQRGVLGDVNAADIEAALKQKPADTFVDLVKQGHLLQAAKRGAAAVPQASYKINEVTDDLGHIAAATAMKLDRAGTLREANRMLDEGRISKAWHDEIVNRQLSDTQIIAKANQAVGDFKNLSSFERDTMRRVMPFYPWAKHITKLAFKLPMENPYRVAWTMSLGDLFASDDPNKRPDFLKNAINLGNGQYFKAPWNPFPGGVDESPLVNPQSALGALSPLVQWPAAAIGLNLGRGRMLTQAPTADRDPTKPGFIGLGPLTGYLEQQFPQARLVQDVRNPMLRYDTGEPMLIGGKPKNNTLQPLGPVPAALGQFLTGAAVDQPDLEQAQARDAKAEAARAKAARQYQRRRARLGV